MTEQREQDIEGHITLGDNIADKQQWSKSETTNTPSKNLIDSRFEAVKDILFPEIIKENKNLKAENQQQKELIESLMDENGSLRNIVANKELEINKCKEKLKELQTLFKGCRQEEITVSTNVFKFTYDVTHFNEYIEIEQIDFLFMQLQKLVEIKIEPDRYLLDNASAVVPIFIILTNSKKINPIYRYSGGMNDFCNEWNSNVVAYIKDKDRAKALTCNYISFKAECGRAPMKNTMPSMWKRDIIDSKNKRKLERAINIRTYLEKLLA